MRCGVKCFYVTIEKEDGTTLLPVYARSTVEARKAVRREYGKETSIHSVRTKEINI
ncbi:hypothetical protein M3210_11390 [Oceanobacillus luteolus]|uniref:Uncharacterized protein n=1 Tax=Oceanobacillus luteolus TaxID=1274358 RepID=A0ABW4HYQ0_9BACI|nr:hypothetical protein [Oceanobacillus luteolus]MCM3740877.1 hypothetical protein [Oceanobacillus luteolus]